jgi:hypothetical protein
MRQSQTPAQTGGPGRSESVCGWDTLSCVKEGAAVTSTAKGEGKRGRAGVMLENEDTVRSYKTVLRPPGRLKVLTVLFDLVVLVHTLVVLVIAYE